MEITMKEKDAISESLRAYVAKYPSQTKAAGSLKGVSVGTVSNILNGRYENISDEMFRNVASQVGGVSATGWQIVETGAYQEITAVLSDAQRWRNVTWVTGEAGCGKSTTARIYLQEHKEVFYILCSEDMKKGDFVREIARTVGIRTEGYNIREVWGLILDDIIQMDAPPAGVRRGGQADRTGVPLFHQPVQQAGGEMRCRVLEYRLYCQAHQQRLAVPEARLQGVLQPYRTEIL